MFVSSVTWAQKTPKIGDALLGVGWKPKYWGVQFGVHIAHINVTYKYQRRSGKFEK